jgi:hypothetical protein
MVVDDNACARFHVVVGEYWAKGAYTIGLTPKVLRRHLSAGNESANSVFLRAIKVTVMSRLNEQKYRPVYPGF